MLLGRDDGKVDGTDLGRAESMLLGTNDGNIDGNSLGFALVGTDDGSDDGLLDG